MSHAAESSRRRGYSDKDVLLRGIKALHARFAHIVNRIACVVGKCVKDALAAKVGTADKLESLHIRRLLNQDLQSGYIRIQHAASNGETDELGVRRTCATRRPFGSKQLLRDGQVRIRP